MPSHEWRCAECELEVRVIRRISDHDLEPSDDEVMEICGDELPTCEHNWGKFLSGAPSAAYGAGWGFGSQKGKW